MPDVLPHEIRLLLTHLDRIATALEAANTEHGHVDTERLLALQERIVGAAEEHNRHHREQGLSPAEPPSGVIQ